MYLWLMWNTVCTCVFIWVCLLRVQYVLYNGMFEGGGIHYESLKESDLWNAEVRTSLWGRVRASPLICSYHIGKNTSWTPQTPKVRLMNVPDFCRLPSLHWKLYMAYLASQNMLEFPVWPGRSYTNILPSSYVMFLEMIKTYCTINLTLNNKRYFSSFLPPLFLSAYLCHQQDWKDEVQSLRGQTISRNVLFPAFNV